LVTFNDNVIVRRPTKINPLGEESIAQLRLHPQTRTRTALTQATPTTTFVAQRLQISNGRVPFCTLKNDKNYSTK
jgi:hypothetical protein